MKFLTFFLFFLMLLSSVVCAADMLGSKRFVEYKFLGMTNNESYMFDYLINSSHVCLIPLFEDKAVVNEETKAFIPFDSKTIKPALKQGEVVMVIPSQVKVRTGLLEFQGYLSKSDDKFCYLIPENPPEVLLLGENTVYFVAEYVSGAVNKNVSEEPSFSHLNVSADDQLVMFHDFEGTGTVSYDYTNNNLDDTIVGTPVFVDDGYVGKGVYTEDGYVIVPHNVLLNVEEDEDFSMTVWVRKKGDMHNLASIYSNGAWTEGTGGWSVGRSTGDMIFSFDNQSTRGSLTATGLYDNLPLNNWLHIAVVADRDGNAQFYANGSLYAEMDMSAYIGNMTGNHASGKNNFIGRWAYYNWNGTIDQLTVWNRTLSADEITAIYNNQSDFFMPRGTQQFRFALANISGVTKNLSNSIDITLANCTTYGNSYFSVIINNGSEANFTNCVSSAYNAYAHDFINVNQGWDLTSGWNAVAGGNIINATWFNQTSTGTYAIENTGLLTVGKTYLFIVNISMYGDNSIFLEDDYQGDAILDLSSDIEAKRVWTINDNGDVAFKGYDTDYDATFRINRFEIWELADNLTLIYHAGDYNFTSPLMIGNITASLSGVADSCTYTSGDWNVLGTDNCVISSPVDLGGNAFTLSPGGTFTTTADITGIGSLINHGSVFSIFGATVSIQN